MTPSFSSLTNKHILLGISGGIAAYKACELTRLYQRNGATVRVIMTRAATEFITPLTMQALSGQPVHTELTDQRQEAAMGHIALARRADALVIAPASASLLARLAQGSADDLLAAVFLATAAPRLIAPAMNKEMWAKRVTADNIKLLKKQPNTSIISPGEGWQACGETGPGRLAEPAEILAETAKLFQTGSLAGRKVTVTAGATREPLDAARFIGNYSSGKMGYALAAAAAEAGAKTTLISGPTCQKPPPRCRFVAAETARRMHTASLEHGKSCDVFISAAAVADLRPQNPRRDKPAKDFYRDCIPVEQTEDILGDLRVSLDRSDRPGLLIGFAAQTSAGAALVKEGFAKMREKKLDMICVNRIPRAFEEDENEILLLRPDARNIKKKKLARARKDFLARQIITEIGLLWKRKFA